MKKNTLTQTSILIHAELADVWNAITNPTVIKKYFFGIDLVTTWDVGSPILFRGVWEGKPYEDIGIVQSFIPMESLSYTYRSSFDDASDISKTYNIVTYRLMPRDTGTELSVSQTVNTEEEVRYFEENWSMCLSEIKKILETKE